MDENRALSDEKKMTVRIYGENYILKTRDSEEYANHLAKLLDVRMSELAKRNPKLSPYRVAVLTALNLADELEKTGKRYRELLELSDKV